MVNSTRLSRHIFADSDPSILDRYTAAGQHRNTSMHTSVDYSAVKSRDRHFHTSTATVLSVSVSTK